MQRVHATTQINAVVSSLTSKVEKRDLDGFMSELHQLPSDDAYAVMIGTMIENRMRRAKDPTIPCLVMKAERSADGVEVCASID